MQIRILCAAIFLTLSSAFLLSGCLGRRPVPEGATGDQIYVLQNCKLCHKADGRGGKRAPKLENLSRHWTVERLALYLDDPEPIIAEDERLGVKEYSLPMPSYRNLTLEQRTTLAEWLLQTYP